jgi:hypothetical protein
MASDLLAFAPGAARILQVRICISSLASQNSVFDFVRRRGPVMISMMMVRPPPAALWRRQEPHRCMLGTVALAQ